MPENREKSQLYKIAADDVFLSNNDSHVSEAEQGDEANDALAAKTEPKTGGRAATRISPKPLYIIAGSAATLAVVLILVNSLQGGGQTGGTNRVASVDGEDALRNSAGYTVQEPDTTDDNYQYDGNWRDAGISRDSERLKYSGHFVFPESDVRFLDESELYGLSPWELYVGRNEIFAWHGRGFVSEDLHNYFIGQDWYTELYPSTEFDAMPSPLNEYEEENSKMILEYERATGSPYLQ